jgi:Spy/CpxP family protein refolding chaperone
MRTAAGGYLRTKRMPGRIMRRGISGAHRGWSVVVFVALLLSPFRSVHAVQTEEPVRSGSLADAAVHPAHSLHGDRLEQRLRLLTRALKLTAAQQQKVRDILVSQREAVAGIWNNPQISPAERAPAVRAVTDDTAQRIRAVLTPEQRDKYIRAVPKSQITAGGRPDVEGWLEAVRGQTDTSPLGVPLPTDAVSAASPTN